MISNEMQKKVVYSKTIEKHSREDVLDSKYGEKWVKYRREWNEDTENIRKFPIEYDIQLCDECNLRCAICHKRKRDYGKLDIGRLKELLCEGAENGLCCVSLGADEECLLHEKELFDIISFSRKLGIMDILVGTNGLLLTEDISKRLLESGVTLVQCSIDAASPEVYKKVRHGDLDVVERNLNYLIDLRNELGAELPQIRVSFCKNPYNRDEVRTFTSKWENVADKVDIQNYIALAGEFEDFSSAQKITTSFCADPFKRVTILANGNVTCCCVFSHDDIIIGNVYDKSMSEIWNGKKMRSIQHAFLLGQGHPEYCIKCMNSHYEF